MQDAQELQDLMNFTKVGKPFRFRQHLIKLAGAGLGSELAQWFEMAGVCFFRMLNVVTGLTDRLESGSTTLRGCRTGEPADGREA